MTTSGPRRRKGIAESAAAFLVAHGLTASGRVLHGPEAEAIVDAASRTHADLVVCGSRGRGHLRSMLLGSVSAGVAAHAPCSVLVARRPSVAHVELASDGTEPSLAAERLVMRLPMFTDRPIDLVTVAGRPIGPEEEWEATVRRIAGVQRDAGDRLRDQGLDIRDVLLVGDPASELIDEARRSEADLIVVGSHDRTGLDRLLTVSVANHVLTHTDASVLVVRDATPRPRSGGRRVAVAPAEVMPPSSLHGMLSFG